MLDLATVCFGEELGLLRLQARSVRLFMGQNLLGIIHLVVNEEGFEQVQKHIQTHVLPEYGPLASHVKIYPYRTLSGKKLKKLGWRSQQAFKLLISQQIQSADYLVLDCKNHFIRPVSGESIWHPDGRMKIAPRPIHKKFLADYRQACAYFDLPPASEEAVWPAVTPFPMKTKLVRDMIEHLEKRQNKSFTDVFMKSPRVTEFYLLYAYLQATYGGSEQFYAEAPRTGFSVMSSAAGAPEKARDIAEKIARPHVFCFGVHRAVLRQKNQGVLEAVAKVWQQYGLVESAAEASEFLTAEKLPRRRRFLIF